MAAGRFACLWMSGVAGWLRLRLPALVGLSIWGPQKCGGQSDTRGCPSMGRRRTGSAGAMSLAGQTLRGRVRPHGGAGDKEGTQTRAAPETHR